MKVDGNDAGNLTLDSAIIAVSGDFSGDIAATSFNETSDRRLKTNIETLDDATAAAIVDETKPIVFRLTDGDERLTGVIAQQLRRSAERPGLDPDVVAREGNDGYYSVRATTLAALALGARRNDRQRLDDLDARLRRIERG